MGIGEGMQVPFMPHFEERKVYIERLKSLLPKLLKYTAKILTKLIFLLIYFSVFQLMDKNIG